jgi:hypothetical protein
VNDRGQGALSPRKLIALLALLFMLSFDPAIGAGATALRQEPLIAQVYVSHRRRSTRRRPRYAHPTEEFMVSFS